MTLLSLFSQHATSAMKWGLAPFLSLQVADRSSDTNNPAYFSRMSMFHLNRLKRPPFARLAFPLALSLMLSEPGNVRSPRKSVRSIYCNRKTQGNIVKYLWQDIVVIFGIEGIRKKISLQVEKDRLLTYCNLNKIRCSFLQRVTANSFSIRVLLIRALLSTLVSSSDSSFAWRRITQSSMYLIRTFINPANSIENQFFTESPSWNLS